MTTILINTASCNSDYIVQLSNIYSLGTYVTLRDNGSNPSFFTSNSIVIVATSGDTFYDGSQAQYIRKSGDFLTFAAMTSSWRLVNTAAYSASGNALLSNASTTNMFIYGELSLSNLITTSLTATGGIDIETPPTVQGIPIATATDMTSTVVALGSFGYFSSVSFMNSSFVSTVVGLGGYGYISTPQLLSTVGGLGSLGYVSSAHLTSTFQGLGSYYLSTPSLVSTVGNLGTFGYISTSWLASTVGGLGSLMPSPYISTTQLFSTVSNSLQNTSSKNQSTFANLGGIYISSTSLVSTIRDMSNLYVTRGQFDSTTTGVSGNYTPATNSTIAGLGGVGYISSLSLVSTTVSLGASNQSTVANQVSSLGSIYISSTSLLSTIAGLGTYGHISLSQLISTNSGALSQNTSNLASTVAGLGNSYVSTGGIISSTRGIGSATDTMLASTVAGLGSPPFSMVSSSALQSTVAGLGTYYISVAHLISTASNLAAGEINNVNSTIAGLGSLGYTSTTQLNSTVSGISATNRTNLISTVNTLGLTYISSSGLQSTVAGLGSFGYVSLSQLTSTTSNLALSQSNNINSTLVGLGSSYISTAHMVSSVTGFSNTNQTNLISTVNTLGQTYISSTGLQSTVAGLGSFGYVSLWQLTSTTSNLAIVQSNAITSTIAGLGSVGYISTSQLNSTVQGTTLIYNTTLISTVNNIGNYPGFISSLALQSTVAGLGTYGHISLSQLTSTTAGLNQTVTNDMTSTTNGLGSLGYISIAHIVSTVQGFSNTTRVSLISTVNTLSNVTTAQLTSTQNGVGTFTTTGQVDSSSNDLNNSFQNIYNSTIAGLGSYYISIDDGVSTVVGINSIQDQRMTSTTNTLGSSVPAYISTAHLVSTYEGIAGLGFMLLPNLTSTTSDFESGSYGTTSTLSGLGLVGYISTAQLVSTVVGYSNSTDLTLISTVNTLGTSPGGFISSLSLQSTVAGLGTTYISLSQLVSTTTGLPAPTIRPDSMTSAVNMLAGTYTYISSLSLQSSVAGLGSAPFSYFSTQSLVSTVTGLGTFGYLSAPYLISTTVGSSNPMTPFTSTTAGLGSAGYISTSSLSNVVPDVYSVTTFAYVVSPTAIAVTNDRIYYTGGNNIYRNTFDGKQQTIFYSSNAPFTALAVDSTNIYTVINNGNQILSISINTATATVLANTTNNAGYVDGTDRTQVRFDSISALCIDPAYKFLYICDYNNFKFRRLQLSNGNSLFNVTTLASLLKNPTSAAVDFFNGYAYIGTNRDGIDRYILTNTATGIIKTTSLDILYGISIDTRQKFLYAINNDSNSIYSFTFNLGTPTLLAGSGTAGFKDGNGSSAQFNNPRHLADNPYDSCVYIADTGNNAIRKMTTTLYASTIAGLNASAIVQRTIASNSSLAYGQFALTSNFVTSAAVLPSIPGLQLWLDGSDPLATGELLFNGTAVSKWWDKSGNGYHATPLQDNQPFSSNNSVFTYGGFGTSLNSHMQNQTIFTVFYPASNYLNGFRDIIGSSGYNSGIAVGIIDGFMNIKLSYNSNDRYGEVEGLVAGQFSGSAIVSGLTIDLTGENLYYSHRSIPSSLYTAIYRYNLPTRSGSVYYEAPNYSFSLEDLAFNSLGTLYSAGYPLYYIYRFSGNQPVGVINFRAHEPSTPFARDNSGNLFYAQSEVSGSTRTVKIYMLSSTNVETLYVQVNPAFITSSSDHRGMGRDSLGNFYLTDFNLNVILKIATNLTTSVFAGTFGAGQGYIDGVNSNARFNGLHGLAIDSMNNLYVSETFNKTIRKIDTSGNVTTVTINLQNPTFLTIYGTTLYVYDYDGVKKVNITPRPDFVIGGEVLPRCNVFTSVVQMGVTNGVNGYLNGTQVLQGSILTPFNQPGEIYTGISSNPTLFNHHIRKFRGTLHEIIVYNTALNTTQRQAVEFYLQQKWIQTLPYAGNSNTTTQRIGLKNDSIFISPNLNATTITAATFRALMSKDGNSSNGFFKGDSTKVTNISDRRLKYDICPIENALEKVSSMQAVRYRLYRDPSQAWIGYVAQDLEVILPEVVRTDEQGWKSIQYSTLPALIIEAVKELNDKYEKIKYLLSTST